MSQSVRKAARSERHGKQATTPDRVTVRFSVSELDCEACGGNLRVAMRPVPGVLAVAPNPRSREVAVTFDPQRTTADAIRAQLDALGLGCS